MAEQNIKKLYRNRVGLEDLTTGTGTEVQTRNGQAVTITKINAANLPFDESETLAEKITSVEGHYDNIDITANDIANINTVAEYIRNGNTDIGSNGQLLGTSIIKPIAYLSNNTSETITVLSGTNGYSVDSLTLNDGASVIVEDGATYKIV